jgi:acyl carrier protein
LEPVAVGVPGELCVGGVGLARGYLGQPEMTAQKFVPDPFSGRSGARLYRTGDRVRSLPDGNIEFLGRADEQVKIRGIRIELGEIEAVLGQHTGVTEVAVVVQERAPGDKRLVAYVVAPGEPSPTDSELREFLRGKLPEHMVPAVYVPLEALPLTANGKLDRRALPEPEGVRLKPTSTFVAPRSELEQALSVLWRELLRVEEIGLNDSFFDLGGNSLLIVQMHERMRGELGVDIPLTELFEYPTIGALAEHLSRLEQGDEEADSSQSGEARGELRKQRKQARKPRSHNEERQGD